MGSIEQAVSDLLLKNGGGMAAFDGNANDINFAPKILTAEEFAAEMDNDNDDGEDNDVMFMSMQDFKKKLDMMSGIH